MSVESHVQESHPPPPPFSQALWDLQKKVPAVHLYGTIILSPNEFLDRKVPQLTKALDKKGGESVAVLKDWLAKRDASIASYVLCLFFVLPHLAHLTHPPTLTHTHAPSHTHTHTGTRKTCT